MGTTVALLPCGCLKPVAAASSYVSLFNPFSPLYPYHSTDMSLGWHLWDLSIIWKQLNVLAKCAINVPLCHRVQRPLNGPLCMVTLAYFRASFTATLWLTTISNSYACDFPWKSTLATRTSKCWMPCDSCGFYYVKTKMKTKTRPNKLIKWMAGCAAIWKNSLRLEQKRLPRSNQCMATYIPLQAQQNGKWQKARVANAGTYVPHLHDVRPAKADVKNCQSGQRS